MSAGGLPNITPRRPWKRSSAMSGIATTRPAGFLEVLRPTGEETARGVSFVICCHNSATRLPPTLDHLMAQRNTMAIPWEVVVVDNASSDNTSTVAKSHWRTDAPAPLRLISEPTPGKTYALNRAFVEAKYEYLCIIDDDNWVSPDWLTLLVETLDRHPDVAVCGGAGAGVFETAAPEWFAKYQRYFAVGEQAEQAGYLPSQEVLWGAGMGVRRSAWRQLMETGFHPMLTCRKGSSLSSGGDAELCVAFSLAGWRLWYEPQLRYKHFIPSGRMRWDYVRRLFRAFGEASVHFDSYAAVIQDQPVGWRERLRRTWLWNVQTAIRNLLRMRRTLLLSRRMPLENDLEVIAVEGHLGRLQELLRQAGSYGRRRRAIRQWFRGVSHG